MTRSKSEGNKVEEETIRRNRKTKETRRMNKYNTNKNKREETMRDKIMVRIIMVRIIMVVMNILFVSY
jgi:hypothetical protein